MTASTKAHTEPDPRRRESGTGHIVVPALAIIVIVLVALTINTSRDEQREFDRNIEAALDLVTQRVDARLERGRLEAESLRGVFAASETVEADEFRAYSNLLFASDTLEGVTALGYAPRVAREDIPALEAAVQADTSLSPAGNPGFAVAPPVTAEDADPVIFVEPDPNSAAFGFDLASNPARRAALDEARDTGDVISTEPIILVQEEDDSAAVILYAAVYQDGSTPSTLEERRATYLGSVSVVLRSLDFIQPVIADERLDVTLYDARTDQATQDGAAVTEHDVVPEAMLLPAFDPAGRMTLERTIQAPGREWILLASPTGQRPAALDLGILLPRLLPLLAVVGLFVLIGRSERRALQEANDAADDLRASQARLGLLVARSPDGLLLLDAQGVVQFSSNEADRLLSPDSRPVTGAHIESLIHVDGEKSALSTLQSTEDGRVEFEGRSSTTIGVDVAAVGLDDDEVLVAVRDATARIEALAIRERAIARERMATERERELADSRRALLSTVSHELKTPLTAILGFSSLLQAQTTGEGPLVEESCSRIIRNAQTLVSLVDDLVAFSRLERDDFTLALSDVDALDLVTDIVESMKPIMEQQHLSLSGQAIDATLDATAVTRIVSNLLTNAARYTPAGTPVEVELSADGHDVVISVDDGGPGVPEEERGQIFERYERGSTGVAATSAGTGVGLWVVRELARRMGGDVTLEDSHLGGARFVVRVARVPGPDVPEVATDGSISDRPGRVPA